MSGDGLLDQNVLVGAIQHLELKIHSLQKKLYSVQFDQDEFDKISRQFPNVPHAHILNVLNKEKPKFNSWDNFALHTTGHKVLYKWDGTLQRKFLKEEHLNRLYDPKYGPFSWGSAEQEGLLQYEEYEVKANDTEAERYEPTAVLPNGDKVVCVYHRVRPIAKPNTIYTTLTMADLEKRP